MKCAPDAEPEPQDPSEPDDPSDPDDPDDPDKPDDPPEPKPDTVKAFKLDEDCSTNTTNCDYNT